MCIIRPSILAGKLLGNGFMTVCLSSLLMCHETYTKAKVSIHQSAAKCEVAVVHAGGA